MSAKRVEYHEGATADVKSAVTWYQNRSPKAALDFIEEMRRATETICEAPQRWPLGRNKTRRFLLWRFPFSIIYYLFRARISNHNLGCCSRKQAPRILDPTPVETIAAARKKAMVGTWGLEPQTSTVSR